MLGECIEVKEIETPNKVAMKAIGKPANHLTSSPAAKKLKQARLPFKILDPKATTTPGVLVGNTPSKKRKLSDNESPAPKAPRNSKSEENHAKANKTKKGIVSLNHTNPEENEVSSSSEAENLQKEAKNDGKNVKRGSLDTFVCTKPKELVPVDSTSDMIDLTEDGDSRTTFDSKENDIEIQVMDNSEMTENKKSDEIVETENVEKFGETENDEKTEENHEIHELSQNLKAKDGDKTDEMKSPEKSSASSDVTSPSTLMSPPASTSKSPGSTPGSAKQKVKRETPASKKKAEEREAERQKRKEEKEREKLEKQRQKEKEKEEKERQKKEEKEKKDREREEARLKKEKEKQDKKEKLEKEKQEKIKQKEEEKKKKQELMDAKNEEKQKKEEEKRKREEEKKKEEEERMKKKQREQNIFKGFFIKSTNPSTPPKVISEEEPSRWMAFEVKKNMRIAKTRRVPKTEYTELDKYLTSQDCSTSYLTELKSGSTKPGSDGKTWPVEDQPDPDISCTEEDMDIIPEVITDVTEEPKKTYMRAKFIHIPSDPGCHRPAYYGTWRKKSKQLSARNPFKKDEDLFDYSVDSAEEWEEEEPGESLSHSEGEGEEEEDKMEDIEDDEDDGFFVPHGYLSEGEGGDEDEEVTPDTLKARQAAKAREWDAEMKKKKHVLRPVVIGCLWQGEENQGQEQLVKMLMQYQACLLKSTPVDTTFSIKPSDQKEKLKEKSEKQKSDQKSVKRPVPEEAMPDLVRLVHGNVNSISKLVHEFKVFWSKKSQPDKTDEKEARDTQEEAMETDQLPMETEKQKPNHSKPGFISKRQLEITIRKIADYKKKPDFRKMCWYVNDDIIAKYKLENLPVPCAWVYATKVKVHVESDNTNKGSENGRSTPVQGDRSTPSIAQFAVPIDPAQMLSPSLVKSPQTPSQVSSPLVSANTPSRTPPVASSQRTPQSSGSNKTKVKSTTPSRTMFDFAKPISPAQLLKQMQEPVNNTPSPKVILPNAATVTNVHDDGYQGDNEDDCMIVEETPAPCIKPIQPCNSAGTHIPSIIPVKPIVAERMQPVVLLKQLQNQ